MEDLIGIGQLSSVKGISVRTIRYYEEVGILKPARMADSNDRYYGPTESERLRIIIFLKKIGFSLQDIKIVLTENRRQERKDVLGALAETIREKTEIAPLEAISETILHEKEQSGMVLKDNFPIKIIGVGGASNAAINKLSVTGAKWDAIHVDQSTVNFAQSNAFCNILLSESVPEEEWTQVLNAMKGSDILFLLAGLDDGYVSSVAPRIAREARKLGILTVGIITETAGAAGRVKMRENVDMLLDLPLDTTDQSMLNAVNCALSLIGVSFWADFEDFKFLIREKGYAQFYISKASGQNREVAAVERLMSNRQLVDDIGAADSIILNITGSKDIQFDEAKWIVETIQSKIKPEANLIFGTVIDEEALVVAIVVARTDHRKQKIVHTLWTTTGNKLVRE